MSEKPWEVPLSIEEQTDLFGQMGKWLKNGGMTSKSFVPSEMENLFRMVATIVLLRAQLAANAATIAAQAAEIERLTKSDRVNALRAKSAEALFAAANIQPDAKTCDCCTQVIPSVQYYEAAGYLCEHCASKVLASRESVRLHLQREAELAAEIERLKADSFVIGTDTLKDLIANPDLRADVHAALVELQETQSDVERLNKENEAREAELAALRSQLEEQRAKTIEVLEEAEDYITSGPIGEVVAEANQRRRFLKVIRNHIATLKSNWLAPHAEKDGGE